MNVAICVGTLVFGGWILPGVESSAPPTDFPGLRQLPPEPGAGGRDLPGEQTPEAAPDRRSPSTRSELPGQGSQEYPTMPVAPTNPAAGSTVSPWGMPAVNPPTTGQGISQPAAGAAPMPYSGRGYGAAPRTSWQLPYAPAGPTRSPYMLSPHGSQLQSYSHTTSLRSNEPTAWTSNKPFAGYQRTPVISPYMDLFRTDNDFNTLDNYYTRVKPRIDQRNMNTRVGGAIRGLQNNTLNLQTQGLMGPSGQRNHMNYGGYYPGLRR